MPCCFCWRVGREKGSHMPMLRSALVLDMVAIAGAVVEEAEDDGPNCGGAEASVRGHTLTCPSPASSLPGNAGAGLADGRRTAAQRMRWVCQHGCWHGQLYERARGGLLELQFGDGRQRQRRAWWCSLRRLRCQGCAKERACSRSIRAWRSTEAFFKTCRA